MLPHAKKVLWVDDDPSMLETGQIFLEGAGFTFFKASTGHEALRIVEQKKPNLILLDYSLGEMSGKEVFNLLMQQDEDVASGSLPVVMLTGRDGNKSEQRELFEKGLSAYLVKPFSPNELVNVIDNFFIIGQIRQQNQQLIKDLQKANQEIQETHSSILLSLTSLLSVKDTYTGEHSGAVLNFCEIIAQKLGMADDEVSDVKLAALLHDIGKIGVPEEILKKPSRLTPEEKTEMDKHVLHGYRALQGLPRLKRVSNIVLRHHEWWDGGGYPDKIVGQEIPLGARIISVVDAYDAMTSDRPYRKGMSSDIAVERLWQASGTQFDPQVVNCFAACLDTGLLGDRNINLPEL